MSAYGPPRRPHVTSNDRRRSPRGLRDHRPSRPGGPRRNAAALIVAALLGGALLAAVLAVSGAFDRSATTVTVVSDGAGTTSPATASPTGLDAAALYARTSPGVVDVTARSRSQADDGLAPFEPPQSGSTTALGTGAVIDAKGRILTAEHVIDGASSITVKFQDGSSRTAKVLGTDNATDVAVLQVDPAGLTLRPLTLGSVAALKVGSEIAVIGDPFGFARSLSTGVVSGLDRTIEAPNGFTVAHAIQIDAALNPGNSGGPVLDARGRIVGIADQIATSSSGDETNTGVGFAVPIDVVRTALPDLVRGRTVQHAYLGVSTTDSDTVRGALVQSVASGSPAAEGGLRRGDRIVALGTTSTATTSDLVAAIAARDPGDDVTLTVRRGGARLALTVTLTSQPASSGVG